MSKKDLTEIEEAKIETAKAKAEATAAKKALAKAKEPKGMRSVVERHADGAIKRPDEIMSEDLQTAMIRDNTKLTDAEVVAIEREIRKSIKRGGIDRDKKAIPDGFIKGITQEQKDFATGLLKKLGRVDDKGEVILKWDMGIDVPGMMRM